MLLLLALQRNCRRFVYVVHNLSRDGCELRGGSVGGRPVRIRSRATPTAIANLQAICARYGAAPKAFIIVPVVGAFLIDLANAIVISGFTCT